MNISKRLETGIFYALLAALSNATIGLFTNWGIDAAVSPDLIAWLRCLIAFFVVSFFVAKKKFRVKLSGWEFVKILSCGFFGIFVLYFFETKAYHYTSVANVVFVLMGTSAVATFILGKWLLKETVSITKVISLIFVLAGLFFMVSNGEISQQNFTGDLLACTAGIGYSLFLLLTRKFNLASSLQNLWYFFLAGSIFLAGPVLIQQNFAITIKAILPILALGIIPTLGGFFCTTKALSLLEATKVQIFEMTEPIFATIIAFIFLGQLVSAHEIIGGILILIGLFFSGSNLLDKFGKI